MTKSECCQWLVATSLFALGACNSILGNEEHPLATNASGGNAAVAGANGSSSAGSAGKASNGTGGTPGQGGRAGGSGGTEVNGGGAAGSAGLNGGGATGLNGGGAAGMNGGGAPVVCGNGGVGGLSTGSAITTVALLSNATGYVHEASTGIEGPWYAFTDGIGPDGTSATGSCEAIGKHTASECSTYTEPIFGSFPNTGSRMCTQGTVAQVIDLTGMTGCPAVSSSCDYSNIFGGGVGISLNSYETDDGGAPLAPLPYNATSHHVIGISFTLSALPPSGLIIKFATPTTMGIWKWQKDKSYASPVVAGPNTVLFSDVTQPDYVVGYTPCMVLDATAIVGVSFSVPALTSGAQSYDFCISDFAALTD
jgi:hypothetical protein